MLKLKRTKVVQSNTLKDRYGQDIGFLKKCKEHGFIPKPSSLAYDERLSLIAVAANRGTLKIFGREGVELQSSHGVDAIVQQIVFVPGEACLFTIVNEGESNSLHRWDISTTEGRSQLLKTRSAALSRNLKISSSCYSTHKACILIGMESGSLCTVSLQSCEVSRPVVDAEAVIKSLPREDKRSNLGAVEVLMENPVDCVKILLCYQRGVVSVWNLEHLTPEMSIVSQLDLISACWNPSGDTLLAGHSDGSLSFWTLYKQGVVNVTQESTTPYGPSSCKPMQKVDWKDQYIIFSGGMPRANFGDHHTITLMSSRQIVVALDFTTRIIDYAPVMMNGRLLALAVLCEEEFVLVDVGSRSPTFLPFRLPYLSCVHSSAISCVYPLSSVPDDIWSCLTAAGSALIGSKFSSRPFPICGGTPITTVQSKQDLLLTGHDDGTVIFWNATGGELSMICQLSTARIFAEWEGEPKQDSGDENAWPPFRRVGSFDPYSDDLRFGIQKLWLCTHQRLLFVGGNGGQVLIYQLCSKDRIANPLHSPVNITERTEEYKWQGCAPLTVTKGSQQVDLGAKLTNIVSIYPPAAITALHANTSWGIVCAGTCHGVVIFDYLTGKAVLLKCTIMSTGNVDTGAGIQRRSFARSVRESFRRLRSSRGRNRQSVAKSRSGSADPILDDHHMVHGAVTQRSVDESRFDETIASMVRCISSAETFIHDATHPSPTVWFGTNSGSIFVFVLAVPSPETRNHTAATATLGKEIKLQHRAPVLGLFVLDMLGTPLTYRRPDRSTFEIGTTPHHLLICSEEQLKVLTLPSLKIKTKEKLTATDGSRVRRVNVISTTSQFGDDPTVYHYLSSITNLGEALVHSPLTLKLLIRDTLLKREDVSGTNSSSFSPSGYGYFLKSPSEIQRFSIAQKEHHEQACIVDKVVTFQRASATKSSASPRHLEQFTYRQNDYDTRDSDSKFSRSVLV